MAIQDTRTLVWNERIQFLRRVKKWTQREAAEVCIINQKSFWRWETGKNYPIKRNQILIAKAFGVRVTDIFC